MIQREYSLKYNPITSIYKSGNYYHHIKLFTLLEEKDENKFHRLIKKVMSSQNDDGGWSWLGQWDFDEKIPSSVCDTALIFITLTDIGMDTSSKRMKRTVKFFLEAQKYDGGWSENPQLRKGILDNWTWFNVDNSVTWITGLVITALIKAGYSPDASFIIKAVEFLDKLQNKEGGWPSHAGSKEHEHTDMWTMEDIISALIISGKKQNSNIIKKAEKAILKNRDIWREPVENPLGVFLILGYGIENQYVQECINYLLEDQKEDGGWGYYNNLPSHPDQTIHWLEVLQKYGIKTH